MTAKEKAKELVKDFYDSDYNISNEAAKQCALIAVDEVLFEHVLYGNVRVGRYEFWESVKQEIETI
jgi:hypothetical protein